MAVYAGVDTFWQAKRGIVQDGLVLNLDAGVTQSYPGNGTIWTDLSGNGNNGTLTNGPIFNGRGEGMSFDGVDDYFNIPESEGINLGNNNFSVSFWYKALTWLDSRPLIYKGGNITSNPGWMFRQISSGLQFVLRTSTATSAVTYLNNSTNMWTNIVGIFNIGSKTEIYANATSVSSISNSLNSVANTLNIELGRGLNSSSPGVMLYYNGSLENICIYNRALSANEVQKNFNVTRKRFGI